jgi:hypothetical protein
MHGDGFLIFRPPGSPRRLRKLFLPGFDERCVVLFCHDYEHRRDRVRALVLLMRWSGLAIKDAVTLSWL